MRRTGFFTIVTEYFYFVNTGYKKKIYAKIENLGKKKEDEQNKKESLFGKSTL